MEDLLDKSQQITHDIQYDISHLESQTDHSLAVSIQTRIALNLGTLNKHISQFENYERTEISVPKRIAIKDQTSQLRNQLYKFKRDFEEAKRKYESKKCYSLFPSHSTPAFRGSSQSQVVNEAASQRSFEISMQKTQEMIDMGLLSLSDLKKQRDLMQRTQQKVTKVIAALGISKGTMRKIRRSLKTDSLIFYLGFLFIFVFIFVIYKWCK